jgi:O-antigen/teichoic acid export membrane protein
MINTSAQTAIKNSIYNFIGFLLPIIVLIFITPIIISQWGVKDYGVYIFLSTITVFLGLLDLGISTATSKHIIEYKSTGQEENLKKIIYSMNSIYLVTAFVYLIICISIGIIIQAFFIERVGLGNNNYLLLFTIVGTTAFIGTVFTNFGNILVTIQRIGTHIKINTFFMLLSNIGMLIIVLLGYKLVSVLLFQLLIMILVVITYFISVTKIFPIMKLKYAWSKEELYKNYKFGLSVAFNNLANSSLIHFDKLLIPIFLGNAQLTYYSIPGSIATKISNISTTLSLILFPITVNLHSINNIDKIRRIYIRSIRLIAILSSALSLSIIFTADKILLYWLDGGFVKQSLNVLIILVLTNLILALFSPLSNLLMAMNKMKFLTTGSFIMAAINIVSIFILMPKYGINGVATAYLISVLFIFIMFKQAERKYFNIHENIHLKLILKIGTTSFVFFLIVKLIIYPLITSFLTLAFLGPFCILLFMILYKLFGFVEDEDWNDFIIISKKFKKKYIKK